ncbi:UMP kinase [archaeon]|nr:UMP kinase [archaeon]
MKKEVIVLSLGGSVIIPDKVDYKFLEKFRAVIRQYSKKYKFVIITGGGKTARNYMKVLSKEHASEKLLSLIGIMATKLNARLVAGFFKTAEKVPETLTEVKNALNKKEIVICGAIGEKAGRTSDANAAEIAQAAKAKMFINITNVNGLYTKDPKKYKNAVFIPNISFKDFLAKTKKIKFEAGQHFVLDQEAAGIIRKAKIKTVILKGIKNLKACLANKKFVGTEIA